MLCRVMPLICVVVTTGFVRWPSITHIYVVITRCLCSYTALMRPNKAETVLPQLHPTAGGDATEAALSAVAVIVTCTSIVYILYMRLVHTCMYVHM